MMWQHMPSVKVKGRPGFKAGVVVCPGGGKEGMVLASWREVCCLSNRGFLSEQKLGCAEVKELGKALNMWGRPGLARMSVKEIINP